MIAIPFSISEGRDLPLEDWFGALAILVVSGVVGGIVFRTLYGPRCLSGKAGRK